MIIVKRIKNICPECEEPVKIKNYNDTYWIYAYMCDQCDWEGMVPAKLIIEDNGT